MPDAPTTPDVLVIGGGNAALCAAIAARDAGASVLLVERASREWRGGNSKYTRNIRCAHDGGDELRGSYSEEEFASDLAGVTGDGADADLTALTIRRSRDAPGWMETHGVRWQPALRGTLGLSRTNRFFLGGGKALMNVYYATAERMGIEVLYDHVVEELAFENGRCTAAEVANGTKRLTVRPRAVVTASGGFEANLEWLREYCGDGAENYIVRGARQNDGRILRALIDAGALTCGNPQGFHAVAVDDRGPRFEGGIVTRVDSVPFSVMLNRDGERFYDEGEDLWPKRYATWGGLIAQQPGQIAYSIFDSRMVGRFMTTAYRAYQSATLAELAASVGLPVDAAVGTIARYNAAVRPGTFDPTHLDDCHTEGLAPPKSHWALPVDRPPFYAYPLRPGITFTYLGVAVDDHARVLREAGHAFDNVFAAGEIMAGNILLRGYLAGFGMTIGTVFGRIAGEEAAAHAHAR